MFYSYILLIAASFGVCAPVKAGHFEECKDHVRAFASSEDKVISLDGEWREPLVRWALQLLDHWQLDHSNAAFGVEIFEHYLDKHSIRRKDYPLYFSTSLLLAIKLNEKKIGISSLAKYGSGLFGKEEIILAEKDICERLRWKTFYIIPQQYIEVYFSSVQKSGIDKKIMYKLMDNAKRRADLKLFRAKGMKSRSLAINILIDAINTTKMHLQDKDYLMMVTHNLLIKI